MALILGNKPTTDEKETQDLKNLTGGVGENSKYNIEKAKRLKNGTDPEDANLEPIITQYSDAEMNEIISNPWYLQKVTNGFSQKLGLTLIGDNSRKSYTGKENPLVVSFLKDVHDGGNVAIYANQNSNWKFYYVIDYRSIRKFTKKEQSDGSFTEGVEIISRDELLKTLEDAYAEMTGNQDSSIPLIDIDAKNWPEDIHADTTFVVPDKETLRKKFKMINWYIDTQAFNNLLIQNIRPEEEINVGGVAMAILYSMQASSWYDVKKVYPFH